MGISKTYSAQTNLLDAHGVTVEVDISNGLQSFTIVGLPDKAVEESRDRVSAAIKNTGFTSPKKRNQKVVVSLAPANIKKEGPLFDLPIALAYLLAAYNKNEKDEKKRARSGIVFNPEKKLFIGELSLDGELKEVRGVLPLVRYAKEAGFKEVYVPVKNKEEAALIEGIDIYPARTLSDVVKHLMDEPFLLSKQPRTHVEHKPPTHSIRFADIKGNHTAKRGLEIAAAGGHNISLYGPPGTGKTMLARAFTTILPSLSFDESLEVTSIHSISGTLDETLLTHPPFRSPHHTASYVSIVGGGTYPKPGEVTLAHKGVLFLDEFPEFDRRVIEALRQPLEDNVVSISRARGTAVFPANFILVASMNPCPCGHKGSSRECICTPIAIERYKRKLSGPIIDRVDMWIEVASIDYQELTKKVEEDTETQKVIERVQGAREIQKRRFKNHPNIKKNSDMNSRELLELVELSKEVKDVLEKAGSAHSLSARSYHRIIKLARTIADLEGSEELGVPHIHEALQYRFKEAV